MSKLELFYLIEALNEWEAVIDEAKAEADFIRDQIKAGRRSIYPRRSITRYSCLMKGIHTDRWRP